MGPFFSSYGRLLATRSGHRWGVPLVAVDQGAPNIPRNRQTGSELESIQRAHGRTNSLMDMRVDHGGLEAAMTQEQLNGPDVGAVSK